MRPTHVVGAIPGIAEVLPPRPEPGKKRQIVFGNAGTIEGFQRDIARSRALVHAGHADARGALRRPAPARARDAVVGINLFGKTKTGKSTMQVVGGSVIGLGTEGGAAELQGDHHRARSDRHRQQRRRALRQRSRPARPGRLPHARPMTYGLSEGKDTGAGQ